MIMSGSGGSRGQSGRTRGLRAAAGRPAARRGHDGGPPGRRGPAAASSRGRRGHDRRTRDGLRPGRAARRRGAPAVQDLLAPARVGRAGGPRLGRGRRCGAARSGRPDPQCRGDPRHRPDRAVPDHGGRRRGRAAAARRDDVPGQPGGGRGPPDARPRRRPGHARADRAPAGGVPRRPEAAVDPAARAAGLRPHPAGAPAQGRGAAPAVRRGRDRRDQRERHAAVQPAPAGVGSGAAGRLRSGPGAVPRRPAAVGPGGRAAGTGRRGSWACRPGCRW